MATYSYKDIEVLRQEEKALIKMHQTLNDQLTRLKVEELALRSLLPQKEGENQEEEEEDENMQSAGASAGANMEEGGETSTGSYPTDLHLELGAQSALFSTFGVAKEEEEEEEEDEDEGDNYKDELTLFCEQLSSQQK